MVVREDEFEITIESGNLPDASARSVALKSYTCEDDEVATAVPGGKLHRCVAVSFLLLCILQVALNIFLHLGLSSPSGIDASCKNLTEERDNLRRINFGIEESCKTLTEERDELKRKMINFAQYSHQGWIYFNGSFYYISSIKETWQDSRDDCLQRDADLVIINSKEEQEFTRKYQKIIWIGLSDRETEGVWKWVDGTPLTTSFWRSGEPNNYYSRNEDCVEITSYDDGNNWNDVVCENEKLWICEKKMSL